MANITFIIGNGFDLNLGLNTRYTDFYKRYKTIHSTDSGNIQFFKGMLTDTWLHSSDFEEAMGIHSVSFKHGGDDFFECTTHFLTEFKTYLTEECKRIDWKKVDEIKKLVFVDSVLRFSDSFILLSKRQKYNSVIESSRNAGKINFLQLNYTENFNELFNKSKVTFNNLFKQPGFRDRYGVSSIGDNIHVHGEINNSPVLGVCEPSQIHNPTVRANERVIKSFIKTEYFKVRQPDGRQTSAEAGEELINSSDILCFYGCSVGATDKHWWRAIGTWLKQENKLLVIIGYYPEYEDNDIGQQVASCVDKDDLEPKLTDKFMTYAGWNDNEKKENKEKIIVELNDRMFKFDSLLKDESKTLSERVLVHA